jgi:hypothetical protein
MSSDMQQAGKIIMGSLTMALAGWVIMRKSFAARPRVEYIKLKRPVRPHRSARVKL